MQTTKKKPSLIFILVGAVLAGYLGYLINGAWIEGIAFNEFIRKLRKKIEPEPDRPRYIVTVRGVGYKYTENEEMVGKTATPPE